MQIVCGTDFLYTSVNEWISIHLGGNHDQDFV